MPKKLPSLDDKNAVLKRLVSELEELDKCPLCGHDDEPEDHEDCIVGVAWKAVRR